MNIDKEKAFSIWLEGFHAAMTSMFGRLVSTTALHTSGEEVYNGMDDEGREGVRKLFEDWYESYGAVN